MATPKTLRWDKMAQREVDPKEVFEMTKSARVSLSLHELIGVALAVAKHFFARYQNPEYAGEDPVARDTGAEPTVHHVSVEDDGQQQIGVFSIKGQQYQFAISPYNKRDREGINVRLLQAEPLVVDEEEEPLEDDGFAAINEDLICAGSPFIGVSLNDHPSRYQALIDSGSECNLMSASIARQAGIPVSNGPSLVLRGATGESTFKGVAQGVVVRLGGVRIPTSFLVVDQPLNNIILGRPWERMSRLKAINHDDGTWEGTVYDRSGNVSTSFVGVRPHTDRNRTTEEILYRSVVPVTVRQGKE
ncbi:hypothetical protein H2203_006968 [Taxawa tesnikishii (nom. ined.)]|nr:hypothetical protein H2203_006968 [Dothideales sp. JES 119]